MATMNRIREYRARMNISQTELGRILPDSPSKVVVSMIETGQVLPNREAMQAICDTFICVPTDLYSEDDLDIALRDSFPEMAAVPKKAGGGRGPGKEGLTEFRVWLTEEEKEQIKVALGKLGYKNGAEWFREVSRNLLKDCALRELQQRANVTVITT